MKSLDFFRRPKEDIQKPTLCGALMSLLTIAVASFLISYELVYHQRPEVEKRVVVPTFSSQRERQIDVSIDVVFPNAPCAAIGLQTKSPTQPRAITVRSGVVFDRFDENETDVIPEKFVAPEIRASFPEEDERVLIILTGLRTGEQCRVHGSFLVDRIPGKFFLSSDPVSTTVSRVKQLAQEAYLDMNLGHTINALTFGSSKSESTIEAEESDSSRRLPRLMKYNRAGGSEFAHLHPLTCFYYLRIIPLEFADKGEETSDSFQYSFHRKCYVHSARSYVGG